MSASIALTHPVYLWDMDRRISALLLLWWETIDPPYDEARLRDFVENTRDWLNEHCRSAGYRTPGRRDLFKMADTGAYPGETRDKIAERHREFARAAATAG